MRAPRKTERLRPCSVRCAVAVDGRASILAKSAQEYDILAVNGLVNARLLNIPAPGVSGALMGGPRCSRHPDAVV